MVIVQVYILIAYHHYIQACSHVHSQLKWQLKFHSTHWGSLLSEICIGASCKCHINFRESWLSLTHV